MPPVVATPLRLLAGWEFSIGPDKTFSALWAIADTTTRDMLLVIHREACAALVRVLDEAAYVRRGAGRHTVAARSGGAVRGGYPHHITQRRPATARPLPDRQHRPGA